MDFLNNQFVFKSIMIKNRSFFFYLSTKWRLLGWSNIGLFYINVVFFVLMAACLVKIKSLLLIN